MAGCKLSHDWRISLDTDLVALCEMWSWKWHQLMLPYSGLFSLGANFLNVEFSFSRNFPINKKFTSSTTEKSHVSNISYKATYMGKTIICCTHTMSTTCMCMYVQECLYKNSRCSTAYVHKESSFVWPGRGEANIPV